MTAAHIDSPSSTVRDIHDYIERGRPHKNLNQEQMQGLFKKIFKGLAQFTSLKTSFIKLHDIQAEYMLRRVTPPYDLVREEAEQFIQQVSAGSGSGR